MKTKGKTRSLGPMPFHLDCKFVWSTLIRLFSVVTNGLVGFEKQPFEVQDFKRSTHHFVGINGIHLKLAKKTKISQ